MAPLLIVLSTIALKLCHFDQREKSQSSGGIKVSRDRVYHVYILASWTRRLYVGMTNDLEERVREHKQKSQPGFTARYNIDRLMYFEEFEYVNDAIEREKEIKKWRREKKIELIEEVNPGWEDLSDDWYAR